MYTATELVGYAFGFGSIAYLLYSILLLVFVSGRRKAGVKGIGVAIAVFIASGLLMGVLLNAIANHEGYASKEDYEAAIEKQAVAEAAQKELEAKRAEAECAQDLNCLFNKYQLTVLPLCKRSIERSAKYQFEWTTGALTPMFKRIAWKNKKKQVVSFIGDSVRFQNGFSAWSNMVYFCDYNIPDNMIVGVNVREGRL